MAGWDGLTAIALKGSEPLSMLPGGVASTPNAIESSIGARIGGANRIGKGAGEGAGIGGRSIDRLGRLERGPQPSRGFD